MKRLSIFSLLFVIAPVAHAKESAGGPFGWLQDPTTNTSFAAMLLFLIIAIWKGGLIKRITGALDNRAEKIRTELDEARRLRDEAAKVLADAERKQREAEEHADQLIAQSREDAKAMMAEARAELEQRLSRREALAEERIRRAETEAAEDVRRAAADAATQAARSIMRAQSDYFDTAAGEIEKSIS